MRAATLTNKLQYFPTAPGYSPFDLTLALSSPPEFRLSFVQKKTEKNHVSNIEEFRPDPDLTQPLQLSTIDRKPTEEKIHGD